MKYLKAGLAYLGVFIIVASVGLVLWNPTVDVSFSETQVKNVVAEKLPLTKDVGNNTYTIQEATVDFTPKGKIHVIAKVSAERKGSTASGTLNAEAVPVYNKENGAFYLSNIQVHSLEVSEVNLSEHHQDMLDAGEELLNGIAGKFLKKNPATSKLVEHYKAEAVEGLKRFAVANLATVPVYKLSSTNITHNFAKLALDKITVTGDEMTVTLSIAMFIAKLWLGVISIIAAIGLAFGLIQSGGFGALFLISIS